MEQFLELFNPYPGNQFLLLTSHGDAIATALAQKLQDVDGTLSMYCFPGSHMSIDAENVQSHDVADFNTLPRALPRSNDMVILQDLYHRHQDPKRLMKIVYSTLANTGDVIIMQRRGSMDFKAMLAMLEAYEFRAGNAIDCHSDYDLVMAKKMHMWGNGL